MLPPGSLTCGRRRRSASRAGRTPSSPTTWSSCAPASTWAAARPRPTAATASRGRRAWPCSPTLPLRSPTWRGRPAWPALRAGLSAAAWDLAGKQAGEPVWRMLGLERPSVRTSYTIAIGAPEEMLALARAASAFGTLKVKLGFDGDLELAQALARELPQTTFRYDANEGWSRERAAASLAALAELGAELVEQPLPAADVDGMAWLKERTSVPLFADEAVLTIDELDAVAELYDGVVVKLSKAGGIASAFALVSACTGRENYTSAADLA